MQNGSGETTTGMGQTVSVNPATGEVLGHTPLHSRADTIFMVEQARIAQRHWQNRSVKDRIAAFKPVASYLVEQADHLAEIIARDNGKTRVEALATEVLPAVMAIKYYLRKAPKFLKTQTLAAGSIMLCNKWSRVVRVPYGVVAIISPWNYPFAIPFSEVVMGLLAGNAVILKVASQTQWVGRALTECVEKANLPKGLFGYLNCPGNVAGETLLNTGIDKIFFTGSVAVGKWLMAKAAETLTPVCLELGGNDPMLVCEDADLDRTSWGAIWGGLQNAGQSCAGVERIYVHRSVYHPFLERLKPKVESLRIGADRDHCVDMGAVTSARQLEVMKRHVDQALQQGAHLFARATPTEGDAATGTFFPATVLTDVHHGMLVMKEETFGPVLAIMAVDDMEQAVSLANESPYGLSASVWSRNSRHAEQIGKKLKAGVVTLNDHLMSHGMAETPWGGFKDSGIGRTHGRIGFDEMTQPQVIVHDILSWAKRDLWWHPYSERLYKGIRGALDLFYSGSVARKLAGLLALSRTFPRIFRDRD